MSFATAAFPAFQEKVILLLYSMVMMAKTILIIIPGAQKKLFVYI